MMILRKGSLLGSVIICILLVNLRLSGQSLTLPLDIPLLLSGNFGELRGTHFHSGLDFRTGGKTGLSVKAVRDGKISRVFVSSGGYGKAVYIDHPDGLTTVYAHLESFGKQLEEVVRELQYRKESFNINEYISHLNITVKEGEVIGYSGNSGSSGGPHLHFEYRDTKTGVLLNPHKYIPVKDDIAPQIRNIYIYNISDTGVESRVHGVVPGKNKNSYPGGKITIPSGNTGMAFYITDFMNDSWNKLGVYSLILEVEKDTLFTMKVDTNDFKSRRLINVVKDFHLYEQEKQTVYKTFGNYLGSLPGIKIKNGGIFYIGEGEQKTVKLTAWDYNGNKSSSKILLKGRKPLRPVEDRVLSYKEDHLLASGSYSLFLEEGSLISSCEKQVSEDSVLLADGRKVHVFRTAGEIIPLMKEARLQVTGLFDEKELLCMVNSKKELTPVHTMREKEVLYAMVKNLGDYTVAMDSIAPSIEYLGVEKGTMKFRIKDELSGIKKFRGEVNGKWCLFEYDAKNDLVFCSLQENVFEKGKRNQIVMMVMDEAGNRNKMEIEY